MGLTKQYRRFAAAGAFGLVGSANGGGVKCVAAARGDGAALAVTAAAEKALLWNLRTGVKAGEVGHGESEHEVTALDTAPQPGDSSGVIALGYHDGAIRLFYPDQGWP